MKENVLLIIKGFFMGIANIIPGVSGGTLAITLGIYERLISAISHFFKNLKDNLKFLIPIGVGAVIAVLLMSNVISYSLEKVPFATFLFFIGLICGGLPILTKKVKSEKVKVKNVIIGLITFSFIVGLTLLKNEGSGVDLSTISTEMYFILFGVGVVAAATMVIPGISGSFVLMLLGFYEVILATISSLTDFSKLGHNLQILMPLGLGLVVGIVLIAKMIEFLFKKFEVTTYYAVIGFILASVLGLFTALFPIEAGIIEIISGILLLLLGTFIGYKLGDRE